MLRTISPPRKRRRVEGDDGSHAKQLEPAPNIDDNNELTIYSWNINGIAPFVQKPITLFLRTTNPPIEENGGRSSPPASLRGFLRRHKWPTMLFLQEVKIHPDDHATIDTIKRLVENTNSKVNEPEYRLHLCLPSDRVNARGFGRKIYGVCSLIRADFAEQNIERIRQVTWDLEGRVLVIETKSTALMPRLAIFNIYAVNGSTFPYKDPTTGKVIGTRHDRKLEFHKLLAEECRNLEKNGFAVILAGDMNIARSEIDGHPNLRIMPYQHSLNRADFESRFFSSSIAECNGRSEMKGESDGLGMIDTFRFVHQDRKGYTYYPRTREFGHSCDRVDMIMTSASLQRHITDAGIYATVQERGPSDHVPLYATFSFGAERPSQK